MSQRSGVAGVLVSLKPEYAAAIAEGRKTVELRRRFPLVDPGVWLVIYATQPVGAIVGMAPIERVDSDTTRAIWDEHHRQVGISKSRFRDYFDDRTRGFAVVLGRYYPLRPIRTEEITAIIPKFCPPQSWRYLDTRSVTLLRKPLHSENRGRMRACG